MEYLLQIDNEILLFINGMHAPFWDYFMKTFSGKLIWIPMYVAIWYVMLRNFSWKVTLLCMIGLALTITFADQVGATLIRPYAERMRPANLDNPISPLVHIVDGYRGGRFGFPSCHAANTFGLAFFIRYLFRRQWLTLFLFVWAIVTCYSRMYLGVHYLGDLLAGMLIGWLGAWLMYCLFQKLSGYRRADQLTHVLSPVLVGGMTIAGILLYSAMRVW